MSGASRARRTSTSGASVPMAPFCDPRSRRWRVSLRVSTSVIPMTPWSNAYSYSDIGSCPISSGSCYDGSCSWSSQYCSSTTIDDSGETGAASGVTQ